MNLNKRGQGTSEFLILVAGAMAFMIFFFMVITFNLQEKANIENSFEIKKIAEQIQKEIYLAEKASDGYKRTFSIPSKIGNRDYNATIIKNQIYLATLDEKYAISLPVSEVYGNIKLEQNEIIKNGGRIYLNYE